MNIVFVEGEAMAAAHICQSATCILAFPFDRKRTTRNETQRGPRRGKEGRATFRSRVPSIQWYSVGLRDRWIERRLHVVDGFWDEVEAEELVAIEVVEET